MAGCLPPGKTHTHTHQYNSESHALCTLSSCIVHDGEALRPAHPCTPPAASRGPSCRGVEAIFFVVRQFLYFINELPTWPDFTPGFRNELLTFQDPISIPSEDAVLRQD